MTLPSEDARKLRRGLRDVSSLFHGSEALSLCHPSIKNSSKSGSVLAAVDTTYSPAPRLGFTSMLSLFASKMIQRGYACKIIPFSAPDSEREKSRLSTSILWDFDWARPDQFEKALPRVEKVILWTDGSYESFTETFKIIKAIRPLNQWLDYYILYKGPASDPKASLFFEAFSELVSKRLGVSLLWLGCLTDPLATGVKNDDDKLALEDLALLKAS
ncbi:MAG: hypothetical protein HYZ85_00910 [Candidatus Omnitrophica bacterium]|nr:hypothetical protein [Candidatus Omnitrophota bacterium]